MILVRLALQSLANRWLSALLTVITLALSVLLFMGVEKIRHGARASFADTLSGTSLIAGARSGSIQLLLYSVFRIGTPGNNITWESYEYMAGHKDVAWAVPLSLGDSHRGFRVLGTSTAYFDHYQYRRGMPLVLESGKRFDDLFDAVLGADVAAALGYSLGDAIVISHGVGAVSFSRHEDRPFRVAGILKKTGTPVDRTVHVSLEAIEAIHLGWRGGGGSGGALAQGASGADTDRLRAQDLQPEAVTAVFLGLKSRLAVFRVQRAINTYKAEPLSAILPGVALQELWELVGQAETAMGIVSGMVVVTALLGMMTMILTTLRERRREMAILRSVGAGPRSILALLVTEAGVLTLCATVLGTLLLYGVLLVARPLVDAAFGLYLPLTLPSARDAGVLGVIVAGGFLVGLLPAIRAYRLSLADGMLVKT